MPTWKLAATLAAVLAVAVTAVLGFTEPRLAPAAVTLAVVGAAGAALLSARRAGLQLMRLERRMEGFADAHVGLQEAIASVRVECNNREVLQALEGMPALEVLQALEGLRTQVADALNAVGGDESDRLVTAFDLLTARIARLEHALDQLPNSLRHPVA